MNTLSARNGFLILYLLIILAYGVSISLYMLEHLDFFNMTNMYRDDAFYYFQIARNFADGQFSTFDGGITRTNGYHPLWMFFITPLWWVFDSESVLFAIQVFQIMLAAIAIVLIVIAARLANVYWLLLFGALPVLYNTSYIFKGLEVSSALFMLGMLFLALGLYMRDPVRWRWYLAIVAFLLPWVRLEYMAISLAVTAILCFIEYSRAHNHKTGERVLGYSLTPLLGAGAGCLVYFAYNRIVFGGYVPVSGATKQFNSQVRFDGEYSFLRNFQEIANLWFFDQELLIAFEVFIYFFLIWYFCLKSRKGGCWIFLSLMIGMFGLAVGHVAKFVQSVITMHPSVVQASYWYYVPGFLMTALITPMRCYVVIYFINHFVDGKYPRIAGILRKSIFVFAVWFIFMNTIFLGPYKHIEFYSKPARNTWVESKYAGATLMNNILPEGSIIGSWDAGALGYFSRFPVVNLDGLVNSYDYLQMRRDNSNWNSDRYSDDYLELYRRLFGVTHFANNVPHNVFQKDRILLLENKFLEAYATISNSRAFILWPSRLQKGSRIETDPVFSSWERIKPHFDFMVDGVGAIIRERFVQIFSDCEIAKDGASLVVLFDGEEGGGMFPVYRIRGKIGGR